MDINMESLSQIFLQNPARLRSAFVFFWFCFCFLLSNQTFGNNKHRAASFYAISAEANFAWIAELPTKAILFGFLLIWVEFKLKL